MKKIIYILLAILLLTVCYVLDSDAVSSGTFTINQWGTGNYTAFASAEAGLQGVLISTCYIVCTGSWTATDYQYGQRSINGWTTYSTAPIVFTATGLARSTGSWDTTKYIFDGDGDGGTVLGNYEGFVYIDGIQFWYNATSNGGDTIRDYSTTTNDRLEVSNCFIKSNDKSRRGILCNNKSKKYVFWNNIFDKCTQGIYAYAFTQQTTFYIYNNTVVNSSQSASAGIHLEPNDATKTYMYVTLKNNLVQYRPYGDCYYLLYTGTGLQLSSATNVSNDNTSPNTEYCNSTASFSNPNIQYYMLTSTDTTSLDKGRNLSADVLFPFSTDIAGITRPSGTAWDIGASEYQYPVNAIITRRRGLIIE
jgi:hypothetical protein